MTRESVLARTMVELADNLVDDFDIVELLTTLSDRCVEVLDIAAAGHHARHPRRPAASDDLVQRGDARRRAVRAAIPRRPLPGLLPQPVSPSSTRTSPPPTDRWPRFAPVAVQAGFRAADAIPMRLRGQIIGALNLFRTETGIDERRRRRRRPSARRHRHHRHPAEPTPPSRPASSTPSSPPP